MPDEPQDRPYLICVEQLAVRHPESGMVLLEPNLSWGRWLQTAEQVFRRDKSVGEGWELLPRGWVEDAALVRIHNHGVGPRQTIPSADEAKADAERVLLVSFSDGPKADIRVLPGESVHFDPVDVLAVRIRCRRGLCKVTVCVVPR